ncbi:MAG: Gfo/Idh/MocA family oxidoreductase, partial [Synergistetes bacterium]|nr:Gfo/Idh/MocA family oxidoreductase [Synergistota bacterium]
MEKRIKVGVVGVGYLGRHHARIYSEMPNVELVGVVDIDKKRAEDIARIYQTAPYYDHTTFIEKESPDAVSIVVPTTSHFEIARDFLAKDIHILVEKPVTRTVEEAAELLKM